MKLQLQGQNYSPLLSFSIIKFSVSLLRPGNHPSLAPSIPLSLLKQETFSAVIDLVIFWAPNMSASLMQSPTQVSWHYAIHANMVTMVKKNTWYRCNLNKNKEKFARVTWVESCSYRNNTRSWKKVSTLRDQTPHIYKR